MLMIIVMNKEEEEFEPSSVNEDGDSTSFSFIVYGSMETFFLLRGEL